MGNGARKRVFATSGILSTDSKRRIRAEALAESNQGSIIPDNEA